MSLIGTNIDRYEIVSILGEGGMGRVYKAKDTRIGRVVALKTLRLDLSAEDERDGLVQRLQMEAATSGRLFHPNIVITLDAGEHDGMPYLVMEFVDGRNLSDIVDENGPLPWNEAANIIAQACDALNLAHSQGIIHRDIKPENIMITTQNQAKVADFGLAKFTTGKSLKLTSDGTTVGTLAYLAPERFMGNNADHRSDIFAIGVVLYEAIAGRKPFWGEDVSQVVFSILNTVPPLLRELKEGIPKNLEPILRKSLSKDVDERYQDISELAADLRKVMANPEFDEAGQGRENRMLLDSTETIPADQLRKKSEEITADQGDDAPPSEEDYEDLIDSYISEMDQTTSISDDEVAVGRSLAGKSDRQIDENIETSKLQKKKRQQAAKQPGDSENTEESSTRKLRRTKSGEVIEDEEIRESLLTDAPVQSTDTALKNITFNDSNEGFGEDETADFYEDFEEIPAPDDENPSSVHRPGGIDRDTPSVVRMPGSDDSLNPFSVQGSFDALRERVDQSNLKIEREKIQAALKADDDYELIQRVQEIVNSLRHPEILDRFTAAALIKEAMPALIESERYDQISFLVNGFARALPEEDSFRVITQLAETFSDVAKKLADGPHDSIARKVTQTLARELVNNKNRKVPVRRALVRTLGDIGNRLSLLALLTVIEETELTNDVIEILKERGNPVVGEVFERLKTVENGLIRRKLIEVIIKYGARIKGHLIRNLEDERWFVRRNVLVILSHFNDPKLIPYIMTCLDDEIPQVRSEALTALAQLAPEKVEQHLVKCVTDSAEEVQFTAIRLLAKHGTEKSAKTISDMLGRRLFGLFDLSDDAKVEICKTLGAIGSPVALPNLIAVVNEKKISMQVKDPLKVNALRAMGRIRHPDSVDYLQRTTKSKNRSLAVAARIALEMMERDEQSEEEAR